MNILFATDGSKYAAGAAGFLTKILPKESISLTVLTAFYMPDNLKSGAVRPWYATWRKSEQERIEEHYRQIEALLQHTQPDSVQMVQREGNPTHCILQAAKDFQIDLLVLGARGHSTLGRLMLGSVSDNVATHANCSVLVVRPPLEEKPVDHLENVLLAYDGSESSKRAAAELSQFHWSRETKIDVVSVAQKMEFYGHGYALDAQMDDDEQYLQAEGATLRSELAKRQIESNLEILKDTHPGDSLVRSAERLGSEVIFLGDSGHGFLGDLFLGSTTKYVLRHAPCSVWISRQPREGAELPAGAAVTEEKTSVT